MKNKPIVSTAIILAAGLGSRLKSHTKDKPKAFLEVENITLIVRSVRNLLDSGITRIIIGTGYLYEHFETLKEDYPFIETYRNEKYADTGSMYTLYNLRHLIREPFLLLESDLLYEKQALVHLLDGNQKDIILASDETKSGDEVFIEATDDHFLINMSKNTDTLDHISGELVGINKISEDTFKSMCQYSQQQYQSGNYNIHYEDVFVGISRQIPIFIKKINGLAWCEIDDENHLLRALSSVLPIIKERDKVF